MFKRKIEYLQLRESKRNCMIERSTELSIDTVQWHLLKSFVRNSANEERWMTIILAHIYRHVGQRVYEKSIFKGY